MANDNMWDGASLPFMLKVFVSHHQGQANFLTKATQTRDFYKSLVTQSCLYSHPRVLSC